MVEAAVMAAREADEDRDVRVEAGDRIEAPGGTYVLDEVLGSGGFSVVWRATREGASGTKAPGVVAVKFLAPMGVVRGALDQEKTRERNVNEFKALVKIQSERVVRALEMGVHEGIPFLVLEYVQGRTLHDWLNEPGFRPSLDWIEALGDELCEAAAAIHETAIDGEPIAHRDLKPQNILVAQEGERARVKLVDLGVAKVGRGVTTQSAKPGFSEDYCAPEQRPEVDTLTGPWSDVFAIAVILFNLGAGRCTVTGEQAIGVPWWMFAYGADDAKRREALRRDAEYLPESVREVLARCLRLGIDQRPKNARALQRELRDAWRSQGGVLGRLRGLFAPERRTPLLAPPATMVRIAPTRVRPALEPWMSASGEDQYGRWAEFEVAGVVVRMRSILAGRFKMGSPETEDGRFDWEGPQHEVELTKDYWLADTPVTQALWEAVIGTNPSRFKGAERPVERVSWDDCVSFIAQLNERLPGLDARLPTEAEWERACRGGTVGPTWLGANDAKNLDAIAWYDANSGHETHDVRRKAANPYGLYDMLGNVREWCSDFYGPYENKLVRDPVGATSGSGRVSRGGAWNWSARGVRAAYRFAGEPSSRDYVLGFRLARGQGLRSS